MNLVVPHPQHWDIFVAAVAIASAAAVGVRAAPPAAVQGAHALQAHSGAPRGLIPGEHQLLIISEALTILKQS